MTFALSPVSLRTLARPALLLRSAAALFAAWTAAAPASAQVPDRAGAGCIAATNKAAALVARAHANLAFVCAKGVTVGKVADFDVCVADDAKGRIAKARGVADKLDTARCAEPPAFGYATPDVVAAGVAFAADALVADIFGATPTSPLASGDKATARCQGIVLKQTTGLAAARLRAFSACKAAALKAGSLASAEELETTCFDALAADAGGKLAKADQKLSGLLVKKCLGVILPDALPGACATTGDLGQCLVDRAECAACRLLNAADGLARDCDVFDNGAADNTCSTCGNGVVEVGEECDDGASNGDGCCTAECTAVADGAGCDDGLFCTATDTCQAGACTGAGDPCAAGGECNDVCNENAGDCLSDAGAACTDDADVCTDDVCDGAGACIHPNNTAPCDDGDPCTTVDTCDAGMCSGTPVPPATTVLSDDFDDSMLDGAWALSFAGVATGWTASEAGTALTVTGIANSVFNEWGYAVLDRAVDPTQDFRLTFDVAWDSLGSAVPIQEVRIEAYDADDNLVAYGGYVDAWAATSGTRVWAAGCSGCSGGEERGTRPLAGSMDFVIERISDQLSITEGVNTVFDATATTAPVTRVRVHFGHWRWSGSTPTFGSEAVGNVTLEAVNAECSMN